MYETLVVELLKKTIKYVQKCCGRSNWKWSYFNT